MEKTAILFSVLLLGWTWTLQGVAAADDQVKTTGSTVVPADAEGATVNTTEDNTATLHSVTDAALTRAPFNATDVCNAPPERGQCMAYFKQYFYNPTSMSCETFIYGGCRGNRNNFKNKIECMQSCHPEEVCKAPPETGPCKAHFEHYFYNSISKSCEKFVYGGCGGNRNNFKDKKACTQRCHPEEFCNQAPETGPCRAYTERYFYNSTSESCGTFVYGGCLGNQNNFKDEPECMQTCHPEDAEGATVNTTVHDATEHSTTLNNATDAALIRALFNATEICVKAPETGPCKAFIERYFYNSTSKSCEKFVYGGCGGNRNNFKDEKVCMQRCHTVEFCNKAPETGPCEAHFERYFYNSTSMICGKFKKSTQQRRDQTVEVLFLEDEEKLFLEGKLKR
ncbi:hypothetical protein ABVT39_001986 [Epinephelus coioides]